MACILVCSAWLATPARGGTGLTPKVVSKIHVLRLDVFEPDELGALEPIGELANALHVTTRERVVRDLLIVEEGELVTPEALREAELALRQSGLFRTAEVNAYGDGDSVDVVVTTRDRWSTRLVFSYSRAADNDELTLGGVESNILGTGDVVSGTYRFSDESNRVAGRFLKRRFLGRQSQAGFAYSESDVGVYRELAALQPFYAVSAPWSGALGAAAYRGQMLLYDRGDESGRYHLAQDLVFAYLSVYSGSRGRWRVGGSFYLEDQITRPETGDAFEIGALRNDRRRQLTFSVGHLERRLVEVRDADRSGDPEDLASGHSVTLSGGVELRALGSSTTRPYGEVAVERSLELATGVYGRLRLAWFGHVRERALEGRRLLAVATLLGQRWRHRTQALRVIASWGEGFAPEELLYVGARSGLRGFPFRAFRGDRALVVNLEERITTGWQPMGIGVGVVLFGDAGYAWERPRAAQFRDLRSDVGLGLRLGHAATSLPFRLDLARGLGRGGDWHLSVSAGQFFRVVPGLELTPPTPRRFGPGLE